MKRKAPGDKKGRPAKVRRTPSGLPQKQFQTIVERKYFTQSLTATAFVTSGTTWAGGELDPTTLTLFVPTQGDDITNRDGRKVQILAIKINATINIPAQTDQTVADPGTQIRVVLVQDRQTNSAQLNAEDVIATAANQVINAFQNTAFFGRFQVWKDKTFDMQSPTLTWDGTNIEQSGLTKSFKWNLKFKKPVVVHFNATNGGTVADIIDNSFHIIGLCSSTALAPTLGYQVRTTFIDV